MFRDTSPRQLDLPHSKPPQEGDQTSRIRLIIYLSREAPRITIFFLRCEPFTAPHEKFSRFISLPFSLDMRAHAKGSMEADLWI